jgi:putative transposase
VLDVSSSGFYDWLERPESPRAVENRALVAKIQAIHGDSRRTYGSPRVHASLQDAGYRIGRNRVARLMRDNAIRARTKRKFRVTTDSRHDHPVAPNRLDRQFEVAAPNTVWVADISYIPTREGWLYLAVVLDLFSRQVVGWAMDQQMPQELTLAALDMAIQRRRPLPGCMHHSDRGSQYAAGDYQKQLAKYGMVCSMSRKGNCWGGVDDWRGGSRSRGVAVDRPLSRCAGASFRAMAPFPVAARQTGRADLPHPAFTCVIKPSRSAGRCAVAAGRKGRVPHTGTRPGIGGTRCLSGRCGASTSVSDAARHTSAPSHRSG